MKSFVAVTSTADGRLTKNKVYKGHYLPSLNRICIIDDKNEPMTFNVAAFKK